MCVKCIERQIEGIIIKISSKPITKLEIYLHWLTTSFYWWWIRIPFPLKWPSNT